MENYLIKPSGASLLDTLRTQRGTSAIAQLKGRPISPKMLHSGSHIHILDPLQLGVLERGSLIMWNTLVKASTLYLLLRSIQRWLHLPLLGMRNYRLVIVRGSSKK